MHSAAGIAIKPSDAPLGAEVVGVDLAQEIDERTFRTIDAAYNDHTVMVFRNQHLTPSTAPGFAKTRVQ